VLVPHAEGANAILSLLGFLLGEVCGSSAAFGGYHDPTV